MMHSLVKYFETTEEAENYVKYLIKNIIIFNNKMKDFLVLWPKVKGKSFVC